MTFHHTTSGFGFSTGTLAYDVKGNQTSRSSTLSAPALNLDWNFDNQLRGADTNGSAGSLEVTFEYDALGRRVSRSHSSGNVVYVHAGQQVIADYARGAVTSSPTYHDVYADCLGYAGYVDEPILRHTGTATTLPTTGDNALYYHRNQQYSIVGLTNAAGTLVERYTYSAYGTLGIYAANGTVRSSSTYANRYTYTGREWDGELRLYHFRARWYDPATGGFVSRDPLGYVDGMSLYRGYFGVRGVDPSGRLLVSGDEVNGWQGPSVYPPMTQPKKNRVPAIESVKLEPQHATSGNLTVERAVCCFFSRLKLLPLAYNNVTQKSWRETVYASIDETDVDACNRRARTQGWWTTPWFVIRAVRNHCPPDAFPGDIVHYGHYCGPFRIAGCINGKPHFDGSANYPYPWDEVDLACACHDCCLQTLFEYFDTYTHRNCNTVFWESLSNAHCSESPTSVECLEFKFKAIALALSTLHCQIPLP